MLYRIWKMKVLSLTTFIVKGQMGNKAVYLTNEIQHTLG